MSTQLQEAKPSARYGLWLMAVFAVAALVRCLDYERVLLPEGEVVFAVGDAFYHARRALYSFLQFPDLLLFDPCINYPAGARIPHPPLLDWTTAAIARLFGDDVRTFERVAVWVPVLLTSACVLPIAALGKLVASRTVGLLAGAIYGLLPICINYGQLGNFDHHAPAGLVGACLALLYATALGPARHEGALHHRVMVGLVLLRIAMMLTWTGSLLYLLPGDGFLLLAAVLRREQAQVKALGFSAGATALIVWPVVVALGRGAPSSFSAVEFSLLHVLIYACLSLLCAAHALSCARRPPVSARASLLRAGVVAVLVAVAGLAVPGVLVGLRAALGFLGASDGYTETVVEQLPLFWGHGDFSLSIAHTRMGGFVYLIPLVPIVFLQQRRRASGDLVGWFLAGWTLLFGFLAVGQVRYVHDFAPVGSVGFALLLVAAARALSARGILPGRQAVLSAALAVGLLAPTVSGFYGPVTRLSWRGLRGELDTIDRALLSVPGSQMRFAQLVEWWTDEAGRCEPGTDRVPAYGVLADVGLGHALHYSGMRATPADPFGPYIGRENFVLVREFMESTNEGRASAIMGRLSARYVATAASLVPKSVQSMAHRLHRNDGSFERGSPQLGRFRLVTEGPVGGLGMSTVLGDDREAFAPYKLFEFVPGATIELQTEPRMQITAELPLRTPSGRRFVYRAASRADRNGRARLRVPYANPLDRRKSKLGERVERVECLGPYMVRVGERVFRVNISEEEIARGAAIQARAFEVQASPDARLRFPGERRYHPILGQAPSSFVREAARLFARSGASRN